MTTDSFINALRSAGPAPDRTDGLKLYGWLIGRWTMDATVYRDDGSRHQDAGEIHVGWVLQGRAIQDVWILPGVFYGTTLRVYDPTIDAWHILWSDIRRGSSMRARSAAHRAATSFNTERTTPAKPSAGALPKSRAIRFAGPANAPTTTERGGDFRPNTSHAACCDFNKPMSEEKNAMIDHVSLGVRDIAWAKRFYDAALKPLGYRRLSEGEESLGYGRDTVALWISAAEHPVAANMKSGLHFCLIAPTPGSVDAFHAAALDNGGRDHGAPGLRADYGPGYYAAFVIDPDGFRIEAHCDQPGS
jgi:catechol 2,3-dioxygenase-like lactoylglutathione lyase family enzyme